MASTKNWQALFDSWAAADPNVASTGGVTAPWEFASLALEIGDHLALDGTQRVLDVGCASGTLTELWAPRARAVVGLDYSGPLLAAARDRLADSNITLVQAAAAALPFADASFDALVCFSVLLCLPDHDHADASIDEMLRVVRPGGRILLGSLPDEACKATFFDHCDSLAPWYQRTIPRAWRWQLKRLLRCGRPPGSTDILWFDPEALAERIAARGFDATVVTDPEFSNYAAYRKTIVAERQPARVLEAVT